MKTPLHLTKNIAAALAIPLFLLPIDRLAAQTDGTWTKTNAGTADWNDSANWSGGNIADGVGATANFTPLQNTTRIVNIDTTSRTVGIFNLLNQHNNGSSSQSYTFATTMANSLTFDNGASTAQLNTLVPSYESGGTNTFSVPMFVGSSLDINNGRPLSSNTLTLSGPVSASSTGTKTISNVSTGPAAVVISGAVSDGSGVVGIRQNSATSQMTLSGTNTHTGGTAIDAGVLAISSNANLGAAAGGVTFNGGTLRVTSSINDSGYQPLTTVNAGGGTIQADGFVNYYGVIAGSGTLTKTGGNVLSLNNAGNTHTGGIVVNDGQLRVRNDGAFGAASNGVTFADGTTFRQSDTFDAGAGRTLTLASGNVIVSTTSNFGWQGTVTGAGGMTKVESATLTLSGTNDYVGNTVIQAGSVRIDADENLGAASSGVMLDGGTLQVDNVVSGTGVVSDRSLNVTVGGGTVQTDKFVNWGGVVSGSGVLTKTGGSTLSLNNDANSHSGNIDVQAGKLRIRAGDGSLGAAGNNVTLADGSTFQVSNFGSVTDPTVSASRTLTLTSGTVTFEIDSETPMAAAITGAGGLTKIGASDFTMIGLATYTGATTINEGNFILGASERLADTSNIVLGGGTLDAAGFSETAGTLLLTGNSSLLLGGTGTNSFSFANSSALDWSSFTMDINGTFVGGQSVRFGFDSTGLTMGQLSAISINGIGAGIDSAGFLTAVPEPSAVALFGLALAVLVFVRRRRQTA